VAGPDGNFPIPPDGTCPACWRAPEYASRLLTGWGVALQSMRPCSGNCQKDGYLGVIVNVHITPHSAKPFLAHRAGGGSEMWAGCQPPLMDPSVPDIWVYPPNDTAGTCDPFSDSRYHCHHKPLARSAGPTKFEVRPVGRPWKSVVIDVKAP
jgi:hypothetical protein